MGIGPLSGIRPMEWGITHTEGSQFMVRLPRVVQWFYCGLLCSLFWMSTLSEGWAADVEFPGTPGDWHGFPQYQIDVDGKQVTVVVPETPAVGRPWVWHGEFFGHKPAPDIELLKRGYHLVYMSVPNMLGSPPAVAHWNKCYEVMTGKYKLAAKVALVGLSRGGLYCYNWASANPEKVACLYGDAPVCDFKSWPGGFGTGKGSPPNWALVLKLWGFKSDEEALKYQGNPVDQLEPLAKAGVPLLHVFGDADDVVPWEENTGLIAKRYAELGGQIKLIRKPGVGHHPHGLDDSTPIVEFIVKHTSPPKQLGRTREDSIEHFTLDSPYQRGATRVSVLSPRLASQEAKLSILFLLPVEAGETTHWGNPMQEAVSCDLANRYQCLVVSPTFSELPWYANHPSESQRQQESHLVETVLEFLRWEFPHARHDRAGRFLVGFSKSGWGAWSLLLRNPDLFEAAAAWDAPLMMDAPGKYGSGPIFGSSENFANYQLTTLIQKTKLEVLSQGRLILAGYGNFQTETEAMHQFLRDHQVPVVFLDGPKRMHQWESGWLAEVVAAMFQAHLAHAP